MTELEYMGVMMTVLVAGMILGVGLAIGHHCI